MKNTLSNIKTDLLVINQFMSQANFVTGKSKVITFGFAKKGKPKA